MHGSRLGFKKKKVDLGAIKFDKIWKYRTKSR